MYSEKPIGLDGIYLQGGRTASCKVNTTTTKLLQIHMKGSYAD